MEEIPEPTKITIELMSDEIEVIRNELKRVSHDIYEALNYEEIVKKLDYALEAQGGQENK